MYQDTLVQTHGLSHSDHSSYIEAYRSEASDRLNILAVGLSFDHIFVRR